MTFSNSLRNIMQLLHIISLFTVAVMAIAVIGYTVACAMGFAMWLDMTVTIGGMPFESAGKWLQVGLSIILASMAVYLPTNARILALERSHRSFHISMQDVAKAYNEVHAADRRGIFTLSSEFDAMRERISYLRDHPDLDKLEPAVLEVAAQMSQQAHHLADVYSDEKVARAREFLRQRQHEVDTQQDRIVDALFVCEQIIKWTKQIGVEEDIVAAQLTKLDKKLHVALPILGYMMEDDPTDETGPDADHIGPMQPMLSNIVTLNKKPAAE